MWVPTSISIFLPSISSFPIDQMGIHGQSSYSLVLMGPARSHSLITVALAESDCRDRTRFSNLFVSSHKSRMRPVLEPDPMLS